MTRRHLALLLALVPAAILAGSRPGSAAGEALEQLRPVDLRVSGGEETWHADNDFRLDWDRPAGAPAPAAVDYRVRDQGGSTVVPTIRHTEEVGAIEHVHVPPRPGVYTAEVWLEGPHGEEGPHETASLRFDDVPPAPARPLPPAAWIAGDASALLRIEHPAGPQPVSGIRGYAIAVGRDPEVAPCGGPDRCAAEEIDLNGGVDDDATWLGTLPEGEYVVRVVAVSGSGLRSRTAEAARLRVDATDPGVELRGNPAGWADGPVRLTATAIDALSGMAAAGPAGPFTAIAVDDRAPAIAVGDTVSTTVSGEGVHAIRFYARDAAGNAADGEAGSAAPRLAIVRIDEKAPRVSFARSQDPADPERIEATVTDPLSGPDPGHGAIAVRPAGSHQRFERLPIAVSSGRLVARWSSDDYPAGSYEFLATGFDAAGNAATSGRRDDGARMVLANPIKSPTTIESGFGGRRLVWQRCRRKPSGRSCRREVIAQFEGRPTRRSVPYGRGTSFGGRLTSASGAPLRGLPVTVVETFDPGARPDRRVTVVHTGADGSFVARLLAGPSRQIEARFAGTRQLTRCGGRRVRLAVLSSISLRASAAVAEVGGRPIVFSGRVSHLGTSLPATGRPVELQFRVPGSGWSEFRTVQTNAGGRFRYAYAFSDDDSRGARFQFRAFAPAQDGWPYEPAPSRPVSITGR